MLDRGLNDPGHDGIDGIGQYCHELLSQFDSFSKNQEIAPYSFGQPQSQCGAHLLPRYSNHILRELSRIGSDEFFKNIDLIHSTDQLIPLAKKPLLATVMDVIPLSHPQFLRSKSRYFKSFVWKKLTQRANRIITISDFSKNEIIQHLGFSENLVDVIPLGVDRRFFKEIPPQKKVEILHALDINTPFFLFLGSIQPRKNLIRLLDAHSKLPHSLALQYPLVIAGKMAWDDGNTLQAIHLAVTEGRAKWLNYVSETQKHTLLQSATALAFVSLYEGFGLPITEAFASNLPVITSNCTSMPEVAGNAALLVDPNNTQQITDALEGIISDKNLGSDLKIKGQARARLFSWEENARKTYSIYQEMVQ